MEVVEVVGKACRGGESKKVGKLAKTVEIWMKGGSGKRGWSRTKAASGILGERYQASPAGWQQRFLL